MLQTIRGKAQGWIAWVLIILICVTFAFWGVHYYFDRGQGEQGLVAKAAGHKITQHQLNLSYERMRRQLQFRYGPGFKITPEIEKQLKQQALNQLITSTVLVEAAKDSGFHINREQLQAEIVRIPAFQEHGAFSRKRFEQFLRATSQTEHDFAEGMGRALLEGQVASGFTNTDFVLPSEMTGQSKLIMQKRDIDTVNMSYEVFTKQQKISEQEGRRYYDAHPNDFMTEEQVKLAYLQLGIEKLLDGIEIDERDAKAYYESHQQAFTDPERWHVAHILLALSERADEKTVAKVREMAEAIANRDDIKENFATIAKEHSDDAVSREDGGQLPWFLRRGVPPEFQRAVDELELGEVSPPVRTHQGFEIIKLLEKKEAKPKTYETVRVRIINTLKRQKAQKDFARMREQLSDLTYENPNTLEPAAKALGLSVMKTGYMGQRGGEDTITGYPQVVAAGFSDDVLQGNNSDVLELNNDQVAVVRLLDHKPKALQKFADVVEEAKMRVAQEHAGREMQKVTEALIAKQDDPKAMDKILKEHALKWESLKGVSRQDKRLPGDVVSKTFMMGRSKLDHPQVGWVSTPDGMALVRVRRVYDGEALGDPVKESMFRHELEEAQGQYAYALYVAGHMDRAHVKVY